MLKDIISEQGITVYRLSKDTGIPYSTVIDLVSGKTKIENSSSNVLYRLSKYLKMSMEMLYEEDAQTNKLYLYNEGSNIIIQYGKHTLQQLGPKNLIAFHKVNKYELGVIYVNTYYRSSDGSIYEEEEFVPLEDMFGEYNLKSVLSTKLDIQIGKPGTQVKEKIINESLLVSDSMCITYLIGSAGDVQLQITNLNRVNQQMLLRLEDMVILHTNMSKQMQKRAIDAVARNVDYIKTSVKREVTARA